MQAGNAFILAKRKNHGEREEDTDDLDQTLDGGIIDVSNERKKYNSFWVGVKDGVDVEKRLPRQNDIGKRHKKKKLIQQESKYEIHPAGSRKVYWDIIICFIIIYSVVMVPLNLGFPSDGNIALYSIDWLVTSLFAIDIFLTFFTGYLDPETETIVFDKQKIAVRYLHFWFWIDFVSTVPLDAIVGSFIAADNLGTIRAIRILRLARLAKLYRLANLGEFFERLNMNPSMVNLFMLIIQIFFIAHLFACFWHFIALPSTYVNDPPTTWVDSFGYNDGDSLGDRYIASIYYILVTMLTVGYGDIYATNEVERFFAIVTMLVGGIVFGALISKVATIIEQRNPQAKAFKANMDELKFFLAELKISQTLRERIKAAYAYYLTKKSSFGEKNILGELPKPILYRLVHQLYAKELQKIRLFQTYESSFVVTIVIHSRPFIAERHEVLFREGDICNDVVLMETGRIRITSNNGSEYVTLGFSTAGGFFGDFEYFRNTTSIANYEAVHHCHLLAVSHIVFNNAVSENFAAGTRFRRELKQRYETFVSVFHNNAAINLHRTMGPTVHTGEKKILSQSGRHFLKSTMWVDGKEVDHKFETHVLLTDEVNTCDKLDDRKSMSSNHSSHGSEDDEPEVFRALIATKDDQMEVFEVDMTILAELWLLHPLGPRKLLWDFFIGALIVFSVLIVPVEIAFNQPAFEGSEIVDLVVNGFFWIDIFCSFRTAYFEEDIDALVLAIGPITHHYGASIWFPIDSISSIPFDFILANTLSGNFNVTFTKLIKSVRLIRLLKLTRLVKLGSYLEKFESVSGISPAIFDPLVMLIEVFFIAHWIACFWWGLSNALTERSWFDDFGLENLASQYLLALYWTFTTMTTVGYGDITPINSSEQILVMVIILLGVSIFGYMIANVSTVLDSFDQAEAKRNERLSEITEYLVEKQCPPALSDRVINHFKGLFHESSPYDVDEILSRLPHTLGNQILLTLHEKKMNSIPVLKHIENQTVRLYLFQLMTPAFFEPDQYLITEGEEAGEILFFIHGKASAIKKRFSSKRSGITVISGDTHVTRDRSDSVQVREKALAARKRILQELSRKGSLMMEVEDEKRIDEDVSPVDKQVSFAYTTQVHTIDSDSPNDTPKIELTKSQDEEKSPDKLSYPMQRPSIGPGAVVEEEKSDSTGIVFPASVLKTSLSTTNRTQGRDSPIEGDNPKSVKFKSKAEVSGTGESHLELLSPKEVGLRDATAVGGSSEEEDMKDWRKLYRPDSRIDGLEFHDPSSRGRKKSNAGGGEVQLRGNINRQGSVERLRPIEEESKKQTMSKSLWSAIGFDNSSTHGESRESSSAAPKARDPLNRLRATLTRARRSMGSELIEQAVRKAEKGDGEAYSSWTDEDMIMRGLKYVGELGPGDFIGHVALMNETLHEASVIAIEPVTTYVIQKSQIGKIIKSEPTVALTMQAALIRSITSQSRVLGKLHRRKSRAAFMKEMRRTFHRVHDKTVENRFTLVGSIRKMTKSKSNKIKKSTEKSRKARRRSTQGYLPDILTDTLTQPPSIMKDDTPRSRAIKETLRKIRDVDTLLAKNKIFYDSDEDESGKRDILKNIVNHYPLSKPPTSKVLILETVESGESIVVMKKAEEDGTDTVAVVDQRKVHHRRKSAIDIIKQTIFKEKVKEKKRKTGLQRSVSFSSLEIAITKQQICRSLNEAYTMDATSQRLRMSSIDSIDSMHEQLLNEAHGSCIRPRRQSFPSLENEHWRIWNSSQGLI